MAKVYPSSKISAIIADWRTGNYTQRDLAYKHKVSNGFVAKHTKGVIQDNEQLVSIGVQYRKGLAELDAQSVSHDESNV